MSLISFSEMAQIHTDSATLYLDNKDYERAIMYLHKALGELNSGLRATETALESEQHALAKITLEEYRDFFSRMIAKKQAFIDDVMTWHTEDLVDEKLQPTSRQNYAS